VTNVNIEDLKKSLERMFACWKTDKLTVCDPERKENWVVETLDPQNFRSFENAMDEFYLAFSAFQKDYDVQVHVPRKQLFDKCAYVDFEGKPAIVCNLCRFYHGLQKGCSWEEEKKELLEATQK